MSMKIILTNGVGFALVAGAVCQVHFSNIGFFVGGTTTYSLNINSTGAKTITYYSRALNNMNHGNSYGDIKGTATGFFVYNGSAYYTLPSFSYGDYSDES